MSADSLAQNTPNAPECICPIVCLSPKVLDFNEKSLHWVSIVHASKDGMLIFDIPKLFIKILTSSLVEK
jgi:hypothetical protein